MYTMKKHSIILMRYLMLYRSIYEFPARLFIILQIEIKIKNIYSVLGHQNYEIYIITYRLYFTLYYFICIRQMAAHLAAIYCD